jgi:hypothetical protein
MNFNKLIGMSVPLGTDYYHIHEYDMGAKRVRVTKTDASGIFLERGSRWISVDSYLEQPQPERFGKQPRKAMPE